MTSSLGLASPVLLLSLALVVPLAAVAAFELARRRRTMDALAEHRLFQRLAPKTSPISVLLRRGATLFGLALLCFALSGPTCGTETEVLPRRGLDLVFAIDVSRSMRAKDVLPDRLERAKAEIGLVLEELGENRIGIVAFAGTAFVQCPLTSDVEAARAFLRALDPNTVPRPGTSLSAALEVSRNLFLAESENLEGQEPLASAGRVLVVVTDGEDHEGGLEKVAGELKTLGVRTLILGVGDVLGEPIPVNDADGRTVRYLKDRGGETVMTRFEPQVLQALAEQLDGRFIDAKATRDLGMSEVRALVSTLEKREFESRVRRHDIDRARWPLFFGLLIILGATLLPARRWW